MQLLMFLWSLQMHHLLHLEFDLHWKNRHLGRLNGGKQVEVELVLLTPGAWKSNRDDDLVARNVVDRNLVLSA